MQCNIMMTQCVVLLTLYVLGSYSFIVDNKDPLGDNITANVISMFTEYNILFHYDKTSRFRVDSIINKILNRNSNCVLMANYDIYQEDDDLNKDTANKSINFIRPIGYKFLHVVMLLNYSIFEKYTASNIYSFEYLDIVLVIKNFCFDGCNVENVTDFDIFIENVNRAGSFFLFDVSNSALYSNCYYCGERSYIWELIANLLNATDEDYLSANLLVKNIYDDQFTNFSGHVFAVGYTIYKPFFWCQLEQENNITEIVVAGSEGELLFVLQEKLNINFQLIEIDINENTWFSIIETVRNGTFDWVVGGVTVSQNRLKVVEFTSSINDEYFTILYARDNNPWMSWTSLLLPFQLHVWVAVLVTAFTVATILFVITQTTRPKPIRKIKYGNFVQGVLRYLVEQPLPTVRKYMISRWVIILIMGLWLLVAQIMTNSYKGKITSSLINYVGLEYDTVDDLLLSKYHFYINADDKNMVVESLKSSNDSSYLEILKKSEVYNNFCRQILQLRSSKKAIIGQITIMQYMVRKICSAHPKSLRLLKNVLFPSAQAWPVAKNVPYLVSINTLISRLNAAGIINKWNNDYASTAKALFKSHEKQVKHIPRKTKFRITSMIGPLLLWIVGLIVATLSFLNELGSRINIC